jgi:TatD DNase family protein
VQFVDTHCHIQSSRSTGKSDNGGERVTRQLWAKAGNPDGDELIGRARQFGVTRMICVGCSVPDSKLAVSFVNGRKECWASIGIHPHEARDYLDAPDQLAAFEALASDDKVVAVGECGLDYFYEHSPREAQTKLLRYQLELAIKHDLPLIFHVREAFDDFWPILDEYKGVRGVLHSYTDNSSNLQKALEKGLYVGVNGIATFTKNETQLEMYRKIPLSRLLLETDSPFLTPTPYRGKICEPYHTSVTAEFLANLRHESLEELAEATTVNARKLFNV